MHPDYEYADHASISRVDERTIGYDRYEGEVAYRQLADLYRAVRLYVNFFQPSMKLMTRKRTECRSQRKYDAAQTPFQRLSGSGTLSDLEIQRLNKILWALAPDASATTDSGSPRCTLASRYLRIPIPKVRTIMGQDCFSSKKYS